MAEDETPEGAADGLASVGLSPDDIKPSIYEGGFKTWECSEDLATYVIGMLEADYNVPEAEHHIIEVGEYFHFALFGGSCRADHRFLHQLGAGTALSSCALLHSFLTIPSPSWRAIHLSFADYNISVIELATIPNLILTWYFAMNSETLTSEGDIDITPNLLAQFHSDLLIRRIYLSGISGMWNQAFSDLVRPFDDPQGWEGVKTTVLASETIYSPSSIGPFTEVVLNVLEAAAVTGERAKALVAAKQIYFGVGGGVDEFRNVLERRGGSAAVVWASEGSGVGRVILEVKGT